MNKKLFLKFSDISSYYKSSLTKIMYLYLNKTSECKKLGLLFSTFLIANSFCDMLILWFVDYSILVITLTQIFQSQAFWQYFSTFFSFSLNLSGENGYSLIKSVMVLLSNINLINLLNHMFALWQATLNFLYHIFLNSLHIPILKGR